MAHPKHWIINEGRKERGLRINQPLGKYELWLLFGKDWWQTRMLLVSAKPAQAPLYHCRQGLERSKQGVTQQRKPEFWGFFKSEKAGLVNWVFAREKMDYYHEYKAQSVPYDA